MKYGVPQRCELMTPSPCIQTYDTGACVYFYFGFVWHGLEDPVEVYSHIEVRSLVPSMCGLQP